MANEITRDELDELGELLKRASTLTDEEWERVEVLDAKNRAGLPGVDMLLNVLADVELEVAND